MPSRRKTSMMRFFRDPEKAFFIVFLFYDKNNCGYKSKWAAILVRPMATRKIPPRRVDLRYIREGPRALSDFQDSENCQTAEGFEIRRIPAATSIMDNKIINVSPSFSVSVFSIYYCSTVKGLRKWVFPRKNTSEAFCSAERMYGTIYIENQGERE